LAISYALDGQFAVAEESFIKAINSNPLYPGSFYNYGVYLNSIADYQSAIIQFEEAMELDYKENNLYYALIEIYLKIGKTNKANKTFQILSKLAPNSVHFKKAEKLIQSIENES
jgi:tetratricopeptide (TPR) repeat protein